MKIFINTFGSRGDVQPYIILGAALKEKGHRVMVCTASRFKQDIIDKGLEFAPVTEKVFELLDADSTILEDTLGLIGSVRVMMRLIKIARPITKEMSEDAWAAAQKFVPDMVVYHPKGLGAVSIAEYFNVPALAIALQPMLAPTRAFPVIGMPALPLGGWYNKMTYKMIVLGYNSYMKDLNDVRINQMGLEKLPRGTGIVAHADGRPVPVMHPISPQVLPQPADWAEIYKMTGYIYPPAADEWQPPAELQEFLAAGEPPVYVGFGSMSGSNPERLTQVVRDALQGAGVRGIIATGWGGIDAADLPETILKIDQAPHEWLFPRMAAVVHHGGAGTTAAGLRAGRPTVICPFMGDQPFWGDRVEALGVGVKTKAQKKVTAVDLTAAIRTVTTDRALQVKAAALGEKIRAEDGVGNLVAVVEEMLDVGDLSGAGSKKPAI